MKSFMILIMILSPLLMMIIISLSHLKLKKHTVDEQFSNHIKITSLDKSNFTEFYQ